MVSILGGIAGFLLSVVLSQVFHIHGLLNLLLTVGVFAVGGLLFVGVCYLCDRGSK